MIDADLYLADEHVELAVRQTRWVFLPHAFSLVALVLVGQAGVSPYLAVTMLVGIGVLNEWYHRPSSRGGIGSGPRWETALAILVAVMILLLEVPGWRGMVAAALAALVIHWLAWTRRRYRLTPSRLICEQGILRRRTEVFWVKRISRYRGWDSAFGTRLGFGDLEVHAAGGSVVLRHIGQFETFHWKLVQLAR